jgi:hypothetical protein
VSYPSEAWEREEKVERGVVIDTKREERRRESEGSNEICYILGGDDRMFFFFFCFEGSQAVIFSLG